MFIMNSAEFGTRNKSPLKRRLKVAAVSIGVALGSGGLAQDAVAAKQKPKQPTVEICAPTQKVSNGTIDRCKYLAGSVVLKRVSKTDRFYVTESRNETGGTNTTSDEVIVTRVRKYAKGHLALMYSSTQLKRTLSSSTPTPDGTPTVDSSVDPAEGPKEVAPPSGDIVADPVCTDTVTMTSQFCSPQVYKQSRDCVTTGGDWRIYTNYSTCVLEGSNPPKASTAAPPVATL